MDDNPVCSEGLADVDRADVVCVSHGHVDHLGDAIAIVQKTGATLIASPEVAGYADTHGIGFDTDSCPLNIGGTAKLGGVAYTMVRADHSTGMHGQAYRTAPPTPSPTAASVASS